MTLNESDTQFITDFVNEGLLYREFETTLNGFTYKAPAYEMAYPSNSIALTELFERRIPNRHNMDSQSLTRRKSFEFIGGTAELIDIKHFGASLDAFISHFNESLPSPTNRGGDGGVDFVHGPYKIDSKCTQRPDLKFSLPWWYKEAAQKCDFFVFNRWIPSHHKFVVMGYASYQDVKAHWELIDPYDTGSDFISVSLTRLHDAGVLETDISKLVNFPHI